MVERRQRLQEVIKKELAQIIEKEIDFQKDTIVTVSGVNISPDLSEAKIFISVLPDENLQEALSILKRRIGFLQRAINKLVNIKRTPKLVIVEDKGLKNAARVEELLEKIKKENEAR
ncbi:30S ribosome-binding factor RbfA [bacterium]|nr:30S ribosome-binding factor RbfA [bacterium]